LREQIEAIIDVLAGHIDDKPSGANIASRSELGARADNTFLVIGSSNKGGINEGFGKG
jgi:hypothetical protein